MCVPTRLEDAIVVFFEADENMQSLNRAMESSSVIDSALNGAIGVACVGASYGFNATATAPT